MVKLRIDQKTVTSGDRDVVVLSLSGQLDAAGVPELQNRVDKLVDAGHRYIVFALDGLDYVSSAGLGTFLAAHQRLSRLDGGVFLCCVSEEIAHILNVLGFNRIITSYPDIDSAINAVPTA